MTIWSDCVFRSTVNTHSVSTFSAVVTRNVGMAVTRSREVMTRRPPNVSVTMPNASRQIEPLRRAIATSHSHWTSVSPNFRRIGRPRTPNWSQAAKSSANAVVDSVRMR